MLEVKNWKQMPCSNDVLCSSNCVCRSTELRMQTEMHSRYVFANQLGIIFERKNSACILLAWWMGCHQPLDKKIS